MSQVFNDGAGTASPNAAVSRAQKSPYRICVRCVMDTTDPEITFDRRGLCSHCQRYDVECREIVESATAGRRQAQLDALVARIKADGVGKEYDCVVGISGGVDSAYLAMVASRLGLRILAVHFDCGWNAETAVSNIENITTTLGIDLYTHVVEWDEMRSLQLAFLRASVANCDIPTDHAFPAVAFQQARKYGVKYILSGSNLATEGVLPQAWGHQAGDLRHLKAINRRFGTRRLRRYPKLGIFRKDVWFPYVRGIKTVKLLNYVPYNRAAAKEQLAIELGWRDYGGKHHESVFTRFFQGCYLVQKFGFDKRLAHYSSLINSHQMTRDEAVEALTEPSYDLSMQRRDQVFVSKKLRIGTEEMQLIMSAPARDHDEFPTNSLAYRAAFALRSRLRANRVLAGVR